MPLYYSDLNQCSFTFILYLSRIISKNKQEANSNACNLLYKSMIIARVGSEMGVGGGGG